MKLNKSEGRRKKEKGKSSYSFSSTLTLPSSLFPLPSCAFTLVELLVAVAVIAIGMVFVLGAFSQCMSTAATAQRMEAASYLLNAKMWDIDYAHRLDSGREDGDWSGSFEAPYQDFNWSDRVGNITADFGNETEFVAGNLSEEVVAISWRQGKITKDISATRYVQKKQQEQ